MKYAISLGCVASRKEGTALQNHLSATVFLKEIYMLPGNRINFTTRYRHLYHSMWHK